MKNYCIGPADQLNNGSQKANGPKIEETKTIKQTKPIRNDCFHSEGQISSTSHFH